jgi:hypothetical protein
MTAVAMRTVHAKLAKQLAESRKQIAEHRASAARDFLGINASANLAHLARDVDMLAELVQRLLEVVATEVAE